MKEDKQGIGLKYAINGIKEAIVHERNFRFHLVISFFVICFSIYLKLTQIEWIVIIIAIFIVLIMELINSVMERIIDYVKPELHPKAKIIKDLAAGVVLLAAILSIILGLIIFLPKIVALLSI